MRIERCHVVVYGIFRQEFVGVREEIALALHKTAGGFLVVRDILPEFVRAEIAGIGFFQKLLGSTQTGFLHFPGNGNGSGSLREGQTHRIRLGIRGQLCDQAIVGISAGLQRKITVLQFSGGTLVPHIPAEQIGRTDNSSLLQLLCDGSNATALRDADGHLCTRLSSIAVDLVIRKHACRTDCQHQQHQNDQQDLQRTALFAGLRMIAFRHPSIPFSPASAACSSRSRQRARPQSGSCRNPAGCPRRGRGSARPPR